MKSVINLVNTAKKNGLYPDIPIVDNVPSDASLVMGGVEYDNFASNNYLGLANDPRVKQAVKNGIDKYGVGTCASRLAIGNTQAHVEFEKIISDFLGVEDAIVTSSGYLTNVGTIPAIMDKPFVFDLFRKSKQRNNLILSDERNHASIVDGVRLSGSEKIIYKHNNINEVEQIFKKNINRRILVVTDGVFSVDGDIARVDKLVKLKSKYNFLLMVDEAHSFGVLGKNGRGIAEHFSLPPNQIDINMGTLSKALGSVGGYIAGCKPLIDFLRGTASPFVLTAGPIAPALALGATKAVEIIMHNPTIVKKLWENIEYCKQGLSKAGVKYVSESQIIMIPIGDELKLLSKVRSLKENKTLVSAMRWPATPWGKSRIRISIIALHSKSQIDRLINKLISI